MQKMLARCHLYHFNCEGNISAQGCADTPESECLMAVYGFHMRRGLQIAISGVSGIDCQHSEAGVDGDPVRFTARLATNKASII